ncbi:MAG: type II toxin-antitoxin system ParD family antitoxin [Myxococcota bacterium]
MATVKKSITVTSAQAEWLQRQIDEGHYGTDSELIREALRENQQRINEINAIRRALEEGEASGRSPLAMDDIRDQVLAERNR